MGFGEWAATDDGIVGLALRPVEASVRTGPSGRRAAVDGTAGLQLVLRHTQLSAELLSAG
jgi:hypothetical protein